MTPLDPISAVQHEVATVYGVSPEGQRGPRGGQMSAPNTVEQIRKLAPLSANKIAQILRISAHRITEIAWAHDIALNADAKPKKKPSSAYRRHKIEVRPEEETWATNGRRDEALFGGYVAGVWVPGSRRVPFTGQAKVRRKRARVEVAA